MHRRLMTLGLLVGIAGPALGQDDTPALLGGPTVEIEAESPTLVERDLEGRLRPLETR